MNVDPQNSKKLDVSGKMLLHRFLQCLQNGLKAGVNIIQLM